MLFFNVIILFEQFDQMHLLVLCYMDLLYKFSAILFFPSFLFFMFKLFTLHCSTVWYMFKPTHFIVWEQIWKKKKTSNWNFSLASGEIVHVDFLIQLLLLKLCMCLVTVNTFMNDGKCYLVQSAKPQALRSFVNMVLGLPTSKGCYQITILMWQREGTVIYL